MQNLDDLRNRLAIAQDDVDAYLDSHPKMVRATARYLTLLDKRDDIAERIRRMERAERIKVRA